MIKISKFIYKSMQRTCNRVIYLLYQNHHNNILRYGKLKLFYRLERILEFTYQCSKKNRVLINRWQEPSLFQSCILINKCQLNE